ncbi:MAG: phosphoribosylanthranilate isomerase [Candidatus Sulfotelmatobacter sp.]
MTWVKICGMTNLEDALVAVEAGADAVGFVFYEKSPRCVSVEAAREIVGKLPERVEKVGVFVDADSKTIREVVSHVGLTAVQLHGRRSSESVLGDPRTTMECVGAQKLITMIPGDSLKDGGFLIGTAMREKTFALLLDSLSNGVAGGTGATFDWDETRSMVQAIGLSVPVIVAGGLTPANVGNAMRTLRPFGVDVASGVEARPGKKDPEKVRAFVRAVREIDSKTS